MTYVQTLKREKMEDNAFTVKREDQNCHNHQELCAESCPACEVGFIDQDIPDGVGILFELITREEVLNEPDVVMENEDIVSFAQAEVVGLRLRHCFADFDLAVATHTPQPVCSTLEHQQGCSSASRTLSSLWIPHLADDPTAILPPTPTVSTVPFTSSEFTNPPSVVSFDTRDDTPPATPTPASVSACSTPACACRQMESDGQVEDAGTGLWPWEGSGAGGDTVGIEPHKVLLQAHMPNMVMPNMVSFATAVTPTATPLPRGKLFGFVKSEAISVAPSMCGDSGDDSDIDVVSVDPFDTNMAAALRATLHSPTHTQSLVLPATPAGPSPSLSSCSSVSARSDTECSVASFSPSDHMAKRDRDGATKGMDTRMAHNFLERRRRLDLRSTQNRLRFAVPAVAHDPTASCTTILGAAVRHIRLLRAHHEEMIGELMRVRNEGMMLANRVRELGGEAVYPAPRMVMPPPPPTVWYAPDGSQLLPPMGSHIWANVEGGMQMDPMRLALTTM